MLSASHAADYVDKILIPAIVALASTAIFLVVRGIVVRIFQRRSDSAKSKLQSVVLRSLKTPSIYWSIAIGLYIGIAVSDLPQKYVLYLSKTIHCIVILSITLVISNLSLSILKEYTEKLNIPVPATGLFYGVVKFSVFMIGFLIILGVLGISITPLITALGVGGLAVALALKDTLENLFAGMHILVEKSIRVGDFIRMETGQEGFVEDITWRTSRIKMLQNSIVVIPNSKLSQSVVINYSLPEKSFFIQIPFSVGFSADPERIERILLEEAKESIDKIQGLLPQPDPTIEFTPNYGEGSLVFALNCRVSAFTDQYLVKDVLRKKIFKRLREEGIDMPIPQRVVYMTGEKTESGADIGGKE